MQNVINPYVSIKLNSLHSFSFIEPNTYVVIKEIKHISVKSHIKWYVVIQFLMFDKENYPEIGVIFLILR